MKRLVLLGLAGVLGAMAVAGAGSQHTVSVTLNYDFSVDNGCSSTVTTGCVKQFNIYDITGGGTPVKLFSIAAPSGANSAVTGITGTSGLVTLKSGVHTFAATAQMADGTESSPNGSTATAGVAPGSPANFSVVVRRTQRLLCDLCVSLSLSSSQKQKSPGNLPRPTTLLYAAQYTTSSSIVKGNLGYSPKLFLFPPLSHPQFQIGKSPPSPNKLLQPLQKIHLSFA